MSGPANPANLLVYLKLFLIDYRTTVPEIFLKVDNIFFYKDYEIYK